MSDILHMFDHAVGNSAANETVVPFAVGHAVMWRATGELIAVRLSLPRNQLIERAPTNSLNRSQLIEMILRFCWTQQLGAAHALYAWELIFNRPFGHPEANRQTTIPAREKPATEQFQNQSQQIHWRGQVPHWRRYEFK